jgi:hypothetical protein
VNRRLSLVPALAALIVSLVAAASAPAKPHGGYLNEKGVVTPDQAQAPAGAIAGPPASNTVYVAQPTDDGTELARVNTAHNATVESRTVDTGFTIPAVAIDKSTSGLSADGGTLVLARPLSDLGQRMTQFEVVAAKSLRVRELITLRGSYSFDAISPDGNLVYLIQYTNPAKPSQYLVRAYDLGADRLLRAPVVDPDEAGQPMTGRPMTRAMSPDGRWAYTLYQGSDEGPFVHALDTSGHGAVCVDLDGLDLPAHLSGSRLAVSDDGSRLTITRDGSELGTIDTQSFAVSPPPAPGGGGGFPWALIAAAAGIALIGGGAVIAVRRRRTSGLAAPGT